MSKKIYLLFLITTLLLSSLSRSFGQTVSGNLVISSQTTPSLNVCSGQGTFVVRVSNPTGSSIANVSLKDSMPQGINYVSGTVAGTGVAFGSNVAPNVVMFTIAAVPANGFVDVSFNAAAGCSVSTVASNIVNTYTATWSTFITVPVTSPSYTLNFPSLSVNVSNNASYVGSCNSTFVRTISITNGGSGSVDTLRVADVNGSGITVINMNPGIFTSVSPSNGSLVLTASQFSAIGNNDGKFDQNESITIYDTVTISGTSNLSGTITANWGCSGNICSNGTSNNVFNVNATINTTSTPTLTRSLYVDSAPDSIGYFNRTTLLREVIRNTGTVPAYNVSIYPTVVGSRYFDTSGLRMKYNQGALVKPAYTIYRNQAYSTAGQVLSPNPMPHANQPIAPVVQLGIIQPGDSITVYMTVKRDPVTRVVGNGAGIGAFYMTYYNGFWCLRDGFGIGPAADMNLTWDGCPSGSYTGGGPRSFPEYFYNGISSTPVSFANLNGYTNSISLTRFTNFLDVDSNDVNNLKCVYYGGDTIRLTMTASSTSIPFFNNKSKLMIRLKVDPGLLWDGNTGAVKGYIRTSTNPWLPSSVIDNTAIDSTIQVHFSRANCPNSNFGTNNIYQDTFRLSINLINTCAGSSSSVKGIRMTRYYDVDTTVSFPIEAGDPSGYAATINSFCPIACADGVSILSYSNTRTTYDRPDNNSDGIADVSGNIDMSKVATTTITWGDTMSIKMRMIVHTTQNGGVPYLYVRSVLSNANLPTAGQVVNGYLLKTLTSITVRAANGSVYTGTGVAPTSSTNTFLANLSLQGTGAVNVPGYTAYQDGDTVDMVQNLVYYSKANFQNIPVPITIQNTPYTSIVANPSTGQQFKCDSTACAFTVYGMTQYLYNLPAITSTSCSDSTTMNFTFGANGGASGNQFTNCGVTSPFPYELRNPAYPTMIKVALPASSGFTLTRVNITWTYRQPGCSNFNFGQIPASAYNVSNDTLTLDLRAIVASYGYSIDTFNRINMGQYFAIGLTMKKTINPLCELDHVSQAYTFNTIAYIATKRPTENWQQFTGTPYPVNLNIGLSPQSPQAVNDFTTTINTPVVTATSQSLPIDINITTASASPTYDRHWIGVGLKPGQVIDSVKDIGTNTNLTTVPGSNIYRIGSLAGNLSKNYRIYLRISSCNDDSLMIYTDRTPCSGYPNSLATNACLQYADSVKFRYVTFAGELQLLSSLTSSQKDICVADTLIMQVTNSQSPTAETVKMNIAVPAGISFIPGTGWMKRGNSAWMPATDPVAGTGNNFSWQMPAADSLAGSSSAPDNVIQYRVAFMTDCSYISGTQISTTLEGTVACGPITSIFGSNPAPLNINGASVNYIANVSASAQPVTGCDINGTGYPFRVSIPFTGSAGSVTNITDSVLVNLPAGYAFSSYSNSALGSHNPPGTPSVQNGGTGNTLLTFPIPAGVSMGDSVVFTFMYNERSTAVNKCAPAITQNVSVNVFAANSLFCSATGANCTGVKVSIGSDSVMLISAKPSLSANVTSAIYNQYNCSGGPCSVPDTLHITGNIVNSGSADLLPNSPLYMEILLDMDLSGTINAGDMSLSTMTITNGLNMGQSMAFDYADTLMSNCVACAGKPALIRFSNNPASGGNQCLCDSVFVQLSPVTFTNTPLYVQFGRVSAKMVDCNAYISFETYSEKNNDVFYIERSKESKAWSVVGSLKSKGNSSASVSYDFVDYNPIIGNSYYRVRQVDLDGNFTYSNIADLSNQCEGSAIVVFPNPASSGFQVLLPENYHEEVNIKLYNQLGQKMSVALTSQGNRTLVNTSLLPPGVYILKISNRHHLIHVQSITINK